MMLKRHIGLLLFACLLTATGSLFSQSRTVTYNAADGKIASPLTLLDLTSVTSVIFPADVTRLGNSISLTSEVTGVLPSANGGAGTVNGIMKSNGSGLTSAAVADADYVTPNSLVDNYSSGGILRASGITAKIDVVKALSNIQHTGWSFGATFSYTAPSENGRVFCIFNDIVHTSWITSSFDGYSWSPPTVINSQGVSGHRYWIMAACADSNGNFWAIRQDYVSAASSTFDLLKSTDQGATWSVADNIPFTASGSPPVEYVGMVQAGNGMLVALAAMAEAAPPETGKIYAISIDPVTPATQTSALVGTAELGEGNLIYDSANGALVTVQRYESTSDQAMVGVSYDNGASWTSTLMTNAPTQTTSCAISICKLGDKYLLYAKDRSWPAYNYLGVVTATAFLASPASSVTWINIGRTYAAGTDGGYTDMSGQSPIVSFTGTLLREAAVLLLPIADPGTNNQAGKKAAINGDLFAMVIDPGQSNAPLNPAIIQNARGGAKVKAWPLPAFSQLSGDGLYYTEIDSVLTLPNAAQLVWCDKGTKATIYQGNNQVTVTVPTGSTLTFSDGSTVTGGSSWVVPAGNGVIEVVYMGGGVWRPYISPGGSANGAGFAVTALAVPVTSSSAVGVITQGGSRWLHSYGTNNIFLGANAGNFTLTTANAQSNVGIGTDVLSSLTATSTNNGESNVGVGYRALKALTTGRYNVATGAIALTATTTGEANNAYGRGALSSNVTGTRNNAFGTHALQSNIGSDNCAFGNDTLNGTGSFAGNSAFGNRALQSVQAGGSSNSALGQFAGHVNTTGTLNTYLGFQAGLTGTGTVTNSVALGANSSVSASNTIQLGNTSVTAVRTSGVLTVGSGNTTITTVTGLLIGGVVDIAGTTDETSIEGADSLLLRDSSASANREATITNVFTNRTLISPTIGASGTTINSVISAASALNFDLTSTASHDLTISLTGAVLGDVVSLGVPHDSVTADTVFFAWVSAADTVTVRAMRIAGTPDPASGTFRVAITRF